MYILGLNAFHGDAAACLLHDGRIVAAIEEERLSRVKHQAGFPAQAIAECLRMAGVGLDKVQHVAINRDPRAALGRKLLYTLGRRPSWQLVRRRFSNARDWAGIDAYLKEAFPDQVFAGKVHHIEHHQAHLASAFDVSPFDKGLVLSVDGFGDFSSAAWGLADDRAIRVQGRVYFPHSLGIYYQALTQYLGFPNYGDEYKLMGLAAYGDPRYVNDLRKVLRIGRDGRFQLGLEYFRHHRENVAYQWTQGAPEVGDLFSPELERLLGPRRLPDESLEQQHKDLAASVQALYQDALYSLVSALSRETGTNALALAGGCGQNSLANGGITRETPIRELYVPPSAADGGGALGAALVAWRNLTGRRAATRLEQGGLGTSFDDESVGQLLQSRAAELPDTQFRISSMGSLDALCEATAVHLQAGAVVGWFQGAMEWGPRALGYRSILADPRREDMRSRLNVKIKLREPFRPFAPSVLAESLPEWFVCHQPDDAHSPFMARVLPVQKNVRSRIPAVTHADGTGRVQSVTESGNPRFHRLIRAFAAHTGVPVLLNTSFNENEPIVHSPDQALDCFLRTQMDVLVLGDVMIERR